MTKWYVIAKEYVSSDKYVDEYEDWNVYETYNPEDALVLHAEWEESMGNFVDEFPNGDPYIVTDGKEFFHMSLFTSFSTIFSPELVQEVSGDE